MRERFTVCGSRAIVPLLMALSPLLAACSETASPSPSPSPRPSPSPSPSGAVTDPSGPLATGSTVSAGPEMGLPAGWVVYTPADGSFSMAFPGQPYEEAVWRDLEDGSQYLDREVGWVTSNRLTGYWANVWEYPSGWFAGKDPKAEYDRMQALAVEVVSGMLESSEDVVVAGYPARTFRLIAPARDCPPETQPPCPGLVVKRMIIVGDRVYTQDVATSEGTDIPLFFDSFQLSSP